MRRIFICLIILMFSGICLGEVDITEINFSTVTSGTFDQSLRGWIDTLNTDITNAGGSILSNRGTGNVYYVDSAVGSDSYDGTSPANAVATLDAAVALCDDNNGDVIYVIQGHAENLSTADGADLDVAGITVVGLGNGADMPELSFTQAAGELVLGAANIVIYNVRFVAATGSITMGISVEAGGDNCGVIRCMFPEPTTSTWEFLDAIDLASGADGFICAENIYYHTATTGPAHFIEMGNGVNAGTRIVNNEIQGEFSVSAIWSDTIDLRTYIANNTIRQMTSGQHCIEFTTTALGVIENNKMFADGEGTCLDPGSMIPIENYVCTAINQSAVLVPATVGAKRYVSKAQTAVQSGTPNLFDVDGGPILITDFYGHVTTQLGSTSTTLVIQLDADSGWVNYDFSTTVSVTNQSAGDRIVFTAANESVLTPLNSTSGGATNLFKSWICGEGMIEATASTSDNDGAITWYMEYIPLTAGVTVTAQ